MNRKNLNADLPQDYARVLEYIRDSGEEDLKSLAQALNVGRERLMLIVGALQRKRLVVVRRSAAYAGTWIHLSNEGKRVLASLWPNTQPAMG